MTGTRGEATEAQTDRQRRRFETDAAELLCPPLKMLSRNYDGGTMLSDN